MVRADLRQGIVNYTALSFEELKGLIECKLANFKKGIIPIEERQRLAALVSSVETRGIWIAWWMIKWYRTPVKGWI